MVFKIDENLPIELAQVLIDAGHAASTVRDEALQGSPDTKIAEVCAAENKVLVTVDLGFADIRAYPPEKSPGYIVLRLNRYDKDYTVRVVQGLLGLLAQEAVEHRLWIVEDTQVRIRGAQP